MTENRFSRRQFLRVLSAGTCGAMIHNLCSPTSDFLAFASPNYSAALDDTSIFILVDLAGGINGYNAFPLYNSVHRDANPNISFSPAQSIPLTSDQGLHPSLTGFKTIWDQGHLALINQVGYANPNRSHDESADIWYRAYPGASGAAVGGWGARMTNLFSHSFAGVLLGGQSGIGDGQGNTPRAFGDLDNFGENNFWGGSAGSKQLQDARANLIIDSNGQSNPNRKFVKDSMENLQASIDLVKQYTNITLPITFPNTGFGQRCKDAAKLVMASELNVRFIYLSLGGFDTHSGQAASLTNRMQELNGGILALKQIIDQSPRQSYITIMSEFGRTASENGSMGTDHGHANPMVVIGKDINGGIKSPPPSTAVITEAVQRGYYHGYDVHFIRVFADVLTKMGLNPAPVFPNIPNSVYSNLGL